MADIDRMFRSELALVAEQNAPSDIWPLDPAFSNPPAFDDPNWDTPLDIPAEHYPPPGPPPEALGLFPAPDRRLGAAQPGPFAAHPQQTVHLADLALHPVPPLQIPLPSRPPARSPADSFIFMSSSEDMDSDDYDLTYPSGSDSEYLPSPTGVDPASLSAPSTSPTMDPNADVLGDAPAIRPSRRNSRTITKVPIPIPNLTKKSRGRKVPTSNGGPIYASSKDKTKKGVRTYTCSAEGCGKCFVRGEHLKRHIRSIHTEEKPWQCTHKDCNRAFSRRDNLNQHLRIHKLQEGDD